MESDKIELAKRAVACRGWRWMPGMRARGCGDSGVVTNVWFDPDTHQTTDIYVSYDEECGSCQHAAPDYDQCLPDLTDPATLGCLLALVREAWGQDDMGASRYRERWCVEFTPQEGQHYAFYGSSEAEALVYALEAAP